MTQRFETYTFEELSSEMLYDILALRAEVFVVEQTSPYLDLDGLDKNAVHLCVFDKENLCGYARLLAPKIKFAEASIGRIVISPKYRGKGLGRIIVQRGIDELHKLYGNNPIRIEAQHHLRDFYASLGFSVVSDIYDWGGIPHVKMLRAA